MRVLAIRPRSLECVAGADLLVGAVYDLPDDVATALVASGAALRLDQDAWAPAPTSECPYRAIAGELVGDAIALMQMVRARRPEIIALPGVLHLTVDARGGSVLLGLTQDNGDVVLVERVIADPNRPSQFGASELPVVELRDPTRH